MFSLEPLNELARVTGLGIINKGIGIGCVGERIGHLLLSQHCTFVIDIANKIAWAYLIFGGILTIERYLEFLLCSEVVYKRATPSFAHKFCTIGRESTTGLGKCSARAKILNSRVVPQGYGAVECRATNGSVTPSGSKCTIVRYSITLSYIVVIGICKGILAVDPLGRSISATHHRVSYDSATIARDRHGLPAQRMPATILVITTRAYYSTIIGYVIGCRATRSREVGKLACLQVPQYSLLGRCHTITRDTTRPLSVGRNCQYLKIDGTGEYNSSLLGKCTNSHKYSSKKNRDFFHCFNDMFQYG